MLRQLMVELGVDPKSLFWSFFGSIAAIYFIPAPRTPSAAFWTVVVGTIFGTSFTPLASNLWSIAETYANGVATLIGFLGMPAGHAIRVGFRKWKPSFPERKS
jgi:hypothetical protein